MAFGPGGLVGGASVPALSRRASSFRSRRRALFLAHLSCAVSSSSSGTGTPTPPVSAGVVTGAAYVSTGAARVVAVEVVGIGATKLRYQWELWGVATTPKVVTTVAAAQAVLFSKCKRFGRSLMLQRQRSKQVKLHASTCHQAIHVQAPLGFHR